MAGQLIISTLSDGTNSTSSTNCIQGSAKAWVYFNGSTATVNGSYNVSSVTRGGTGLYTVTFTNAFANTNYSSYASAGDPTQSSANAAFTFIGTPTTTTQFVATRNGANASVDWATVNLAVFSN